MYVLSQALRHRQAQPDLYLSGDYVPLAAHGRYHSYLCAFARLHQDQAIVVIAPRFRASMEAQQQGSSPDEVWRDTSVTIPSWKPGSVYRHLFTGERFETTGYEQHQVLSVGAVLRHCPVGLLIRSEP